LQTAIPIRCNGEHTSVDPDAGCDISTIGEQAMSIYQGSVTTYDLTIQSPNVFTNYKSVIHVRGDFGLGFLYFVPEGGQLGTNRKRTGQNVFDVYYWMGSWTHFVDALRNEKPIFFYYDDSTNTAVLRTTDEPVGEEE
jgi:hypothetical protein